MKKAYVVFTEQKRIKGRTSATIFKKNEKFDCIGEFNYSNGSNRGKNAEIIAELVRIGELPEEALDRGGYPNYPLVEGLVDVLVIEGRGICYYSKI